MTPLQLDIFVCSLACMSLFGLPTAIWGNLGLTSCRWLALSLCSCNTPLVGARVWYCLGFDKVVVGFFPQYVLYLAQINFGCAYTGLSYYQFDEVNFTYIQRFCRSFRVFSLFRCKSLGAE